MKKNLGGMFKLVSKHKFKLLIVLILILLISGGVYLYISIQNGIWKKAEDYYRRADYAKAATEIKKVTFPSDENRLTIYGQTMFATKDYKSSSRAYEKIYDINKDPNAKLMIGNIANQVGDYDKAVKSYQEIINNNPNFIKAYSNLAMVYRIKGDNKKAIETAKDGAINNPNSTEMYVLLVSVLGTNDETKNSTDYTDAKEKLRRLDPKNPLLDQENI